MKTIIQWIAGSSLTCPTGAKTIWSLWQAIKWRIASLPGLDAYITTTGEVVVFKQHKD